MRLIRTHSFTDFLSVFAAEELSRNQPFLRERVREREKRGRKGSKKRGRREEAERGDWKRRERED